MIPKLGAITGIASMCKHCGEEILFDDWCYVHVYSGWADCGVEISGGEQIFSGPNGSTIRVNPDIKSGKKTVATPCSEGGTK